MIREATSTQIHKSFEVFTVVSVKLRSYDLWHCVVLKVDTNVSEKHAAWIFKIQVYRVMYIGFKEDGHSGPQEGLTCIVHV